ncbi:post-segregation antitoxin CcdA [Brenneria nigrifluens DSM 30175 = ATCC 13028]|uniref:Post-segregation antitoxin CcdA n=2 Tax=Pectobacteriaceae TaxID=1903410 RepID=A0A2U1ULL9_9GAMM|nr:Post-segregation antitoxin CcdA [Brenneria sp. EniD312]PWC22590.1 post-segregation antitoxin CcdA [Brenneria nigrifluens DSM 30175 = ATCC 13028]QCR06764.1 post-segregation antitoxin CcdA [Brenneria nigrifluens DSM 30175 = ATCC 13028]
MVSVASSRKRTINITVDPLLADRAKKLSLNISAIAGEALAAKVRELEQARWLEENQEAIKAMNRFVTENGIPRSSKGLRVTRPTAGV